MPRTLVRPLLAITLLASSVITAYAQTVPPVSGALIELSAEASRASANDLFQATAYAESSHSNSATVARQVNQQIASALNTAKAYPGVKVKTGSSHTYPVYGKSDRTIEAWRMRSEIQLESRDAAVLAELLGKLQNNLAISQLSASPSPETLQKTEADATVSAIHVFRERANLIATTLGKKYRIREMNVGNSNRGPLYPMLRGKAMMAAEAAPMPVEAGESQIVVNINGKIELID